VHQNRHTISITYGIYKSREARESSILGVYKSYTKIGINSRTS